MTFFSTQLAAEARSSSANQFNFGEFQKLPRQTIAIPLGFGLVSVVFFIAIVTHLLSLGRWVEETDRTIASANTIMQLLSDQQNGVRGYVLNGQESSLEPYAAGTRRMLATVNSTRQMLEDDPVQQQRISSAYDNYLRWHQIAELAIQRKREGKSIEDLIANSGGIQMMDQARNSMRELIATEEMIKSERSHRANLLVLILSVSYFAGSLIFSGLMGYWGRTQLRNLTANYRASLLHQQHQTQTLQRQAWLRSGQTLLAKHILGQLPLPIVCQNVLNVLAEYQGVAVGALYVSTNSEELERMAVYGYTVPASAPCFEDRNGLVAEVAATRQPLFLRDSSPDYFRVNPHLKVNAANSKINSTAPNLTKTSRAIERYSAIEIENAIEEGEKNPVAVAIYPVISENALQAVLELGFLRPLTELDAEFLELVAENIGAAIVAAGYRRRLHDTLMDMQQLNEELIEAQRLLEERAELLESASRYKSEFLANMSHELRTPLNSLLILSQLLADNDDGNLSADQIKYAQSIRTAGNDLLSLINDVLDISKVEAGKLEVAAAQTSLQETLDTVVNYFRPLAKQKNLEFALTLDPGLPALLFTDQQRLEQILRNLLSNAMKFTSSGEVDLRVSLHEIDGWLKFTVRDTGIGIAPAQIERIFEPFYQVDSTTSRKFGGTGLGLSISRQLAELLGGQIEVQSQLGIGSAFTLLIPSNIYLAEYQSPRYARVTNEVADEASIQPSVTTHFDDDRHRLDDAKKVILIVDDDPAFARFLCDVAQEMNYQCLVAMYAEEGWGLARQHSIHAILLDTKLPDQSGMSLLARIKNEPRTRHIPVHVIAVDDCNKTAMHLGAIGYLQKPASQPQLRDVLLGIEAKIANKMKHVLVAEEAAQAEATAQLIGNADIEVIIARNGEDALALLRARSFDCLVIDLDLPDMKSEELLLRMAASESFSFPPVIVHAAREVTREEQERLLHYSRSIIVKGPHSRERLLDEVALFLHRAESEMSPRQRSLMQLARKHDMALENRCILVVDDDIRNVFAITSALEKNGARVEIARNGLDALQKLDEHNEIDLVLMDIMMPEMDGYTAMEEIRKQSRFKSLPIIAVTGRAMRDDQERTLRAGATDYVAKPIDLERLISLIRVWLPKVR